MLLDLLAETILALTQVKMRQGFRVADCWYHDRTVNECHGWDIVQWEIPMWTSVLLDIKSGMVFSFSRLFHLKSCTANKSSNFSQTFPLHECFRQRLFRKYQYCFNKFHQQICKMLTKFRMLPYFYWSVFCLKGWSRAGSRKLTNIWDSFF